MSELEVRTLRNQVYGLPRKDKDGIWRDDGWDGCRENWLQPSEIEWLKQQVIQKLLPKPI